ncbi:MAG TPA: DUF1801 domain-containing protein [Actinomycetota bacterium]
MAARSSIETIPPEALLADFTPSHVAMAERLRTLVRASAPDAIERVRSGWRLIGYDLPRRRGTTFFAWIWPQPEHVHLGFPLGIVMSDPDGLMQGAGITKQARWLTYDTVDDINEGVAKRLIEEALRVAGMSHDERRAILFDRELGRA